MKRTLWMLSVVVLGCADAPAPTPDEPITAADSVGGATPLGPAERFERSFAFVGGETDSLLVVAWSREAASRPEGVERIARGAVSFAASWQPLHRRSEATGPSSSPWRVLPDASMRLLVGVGDGIEEIGFVGDAPDVALTFGDSRSEWTSGQGGAFRLSDATARLGDRTVEGMVMDVTRSWTDERDMPPGDWIFVTSGDSLSVFLQTPDADGETWTAWARRGLENDTWPEVAVTWGAVRAFDRARRDVPVSWTLSTEAGDLTGLLDLRTADLEAGEGEGPLLPVDGFFEVTGRLVMDGIEVPVRGLVRHQQR